MLPYDDQTSQEQDPQNEALIRDLQQLYKSDPRVQPLPIFCRGEEQAIAKVRRRLLTHELWSEETRIHTTPEVAQGRARMRQWPRFLMIAALLLLVLGSAGIFALLASQEHQSKQVSAEQTLKDRQQKAHLLIRQFHQEANTWGEFHVYNDRFDGKNYALDQPYLQSGLGNDLDYTLDTSFTEADYEQLISQVKMDLFLLHQFEFNATDSTPSNLAHQSDFHVLNFYHWSSQQVAVVSLAEQCLRLYEHGRLLRSMPVHAGSVIRPTLPGGWIMVKHTMMLKYETPQSQARMVPVWNYAQTAASARDYSMSGSHISYGMAGPGPQFPHPGVPAKNCDGVELSNSDAEWLYKRTNLDTKLVIY